MDWEQFVYDWNTGEVAIFFGSIGVIVAFLWLVLSLFPLLVPYFWRKPLWKVKLGYVSVAMFLALALSALVYIGLTRNTTWLMLVFAICASGLFAAMNYIDYAESVRRNTFDTYGKPEDMPAAHTTTATTA